MTHELNCATCQKKITVTITVEGVVSNGYYWADEGYLIYWHATTPGLMQIDSAWCRKCTPLKEEEQGLIA